MSSTLAYRPINPNIHKTCGDAIKSILRERYDLGEKSKILDIDDIEYLRRLYDAGLVDAGLLIQEINTYGKVEIFLIY